MEKQIHHGRNIKRIREMLGKKQDQLADDLGGDWNQKRVSLLEGKEEIDESTLKEVAKALNVPVEAIKNFDEEIAIHNIQNNYDSAVVNGGPTIHYKNTVSVDPALLAVLNRLIDVMEKLKKK